jgi:malate dehydrogenase
MAGVLDSARMRFFLSEKTGTAPRDVSAMVLGGHGDLMVPVMSQVKVKGKPLTGLSPEERDAIVRRTRQGGAEIVALLKTGSAFYAPASSVVEMVKAILGDTGAVLPVCAYCTGEYGIRNTCCGVPARLGRNGIREIVEIPLTAEEKAALLESARKVQKGVEELEALKLSG